MPCYADQVAASQGEEQKAIENGFAAPSRCLASVPNDETYEEETDDAALLSFPSGHSASADSPPPRTQSDFGSHQKFEARESHTAGLPAHSGSATSAAPRGGERDGAPVAHGRAAPRILTSHPVRTVYRETMLTPEQREMVNFIGVGGKLPVQIGERYNSEYPPDLLALMDAGYVIATRSSSKIRAMRCAAGS